MTYQYTALGETVYTHMLKNGLQICYLPKPSFSKTVAMLATRYGASDRTFVVQGQRVHTPAGVAHFLEHKMFEQENGNALQQFGAMGACPNAFTMQGMTAYYFSCVERLEENLSLLLRMVFTPYFTEQNVKKECGIIAQEIGMIEDTPSWQLYMGLLRGLYHEHPARISIAGSVDSIGQITPEMLYTCHRTFYQPSNMVLAVCGKADFEALCAQAERLSPTTGATIIGQREYGVRQSTVAAPLVEQHMATAQTRFLLGFKDTAPAQGESSLRHELKGMLGAFVLCGKTTPLYMRLYEQRLINRTFDCDYTHIPEGAFAILGGESCDPYRVREVIQAEVEQLAHEGIPEELFCRMKRALYGLQLRTLDMPDCYVRNQVEAMLDGAQYAAFAALLDTITADELQTMFARWAQHSTLSVVSAEARRTA